MLPTIDERVAACERTTMVDHLPRLVFAGKVGTSKDWRRLDELDWFIRGHTCFIYHLFNSAGKAIYIGKAITLSYRFQAHAGKKPWWRSAAHLNLYVVSCESHLSRACKGFGNNPRSDVERAALLWERRAIADLQPQHNIAHNPRVLAPTSRGRVNG